jgi:hypothetical protein
MDKLTVLAGMIVFTYPLFGQSINVEIPPEIQAYGVTLVPADSPAASEHIGKIAGSDVGAIKSLLPYSVVLVNNGGNRLLATLVGFRWTDSSDIPHTFTFALNDFNRGYPSQIAPGGSRLFLLQRGLNLYFARRAARPEKADRTSLTQSANLIKGITSTVTHAKSITAFIDSVVIEGYGIVGPDTKMMRSNGWNRVSTY